MALVKGMTENQGARMFHLMMIIPAGVLLLLLSLVSLGTMANANKQVKDEIDDRNWEGRCILYMKEGDQDVKIPVREFNDGGECEFAVWGGAILAILAVVLSIVLGVKALLGIPVLSFFAIIELGISVGGAVWAFIVGVVITAGLNVTCKGYRDAHDVEDHVPCCYFFVGQNIQNGFFFYEPVNTSRITVWFAMGLLICLAILYAIILIMFCCRGGRINHKSGGATTVVKELPESAGE